MSKLYDLLSAMCGKIKKPDWNQTDETAPDFLKNKPFGDNADGTVYPMSGKYVEGMGYVEPSTAEITWDGNTDGLVEFLGYYKASDVVLTPEQLIGQQAVGVMPSGENPFVITEDALKFEDYGFAFEGTVLVVSDEQWGYPKGTYLMSYPTPGVYIGRVTYATETIHPIDQKFLNVFRVKFETADGQNFTGADKTIDEIIEAFKNGKTVIGCFEMDMNGMYVGGVLPLCSVNNSGDMKSCMFNTFVIAETNMVAQLLTYKENGGETTITVSMHTFAN